MPYLIIKQYRVIVVFLAYLSVAPSMGEILVVLVLQDVRYGVFYPGGREKGREGGG